jgi:hypothetical protein
MKSHGKSIKTVFCQLIAWTPPKEGITLLEFFGGMIQVLKFYYSQRWWFENIFT